MQPLCWLSGGDFHSKLALRDKDLYHVKRGIQRFYLLLTYTVTPESPSDIQVLEGIVEN